MATTTEDRFDASTSGTIKATIAGKRYTLRRPTLGENRRWVEHLTELQEQQAAAREANTYEPAEFEHALFDYWRDVFRTLDTSKEAGELPDDDDALPPWFLAPELIVEVRQHWSSVPWGPGGSPSQKAAVAVERSIGPAARLLAAANATPPQS